MFWSLTTALATSDQRGFHIPSNWNNWFLTCFGKAGKIDAFKESFLFIYGCWAFNYIV